MSGNFKLKYQTTCILIYLTACILILPECVINCQIVLYSNIRQHIYTLYLNGTIGMSCEEVSSRSRTHAVWAFTFMNTESTDIAIIHWLYDTDPEYTYNVESSYLNHVVIFFFFLPNFKTWKILSQKNFCAYLCPFDESLMKSWFVSGTTFWMNTCWSSCSP